MKADSDDLRPSEVAAVSNPHWDRGEELDHHRRAVSRRCRSDQRHHLSSDGDTPDSALGRAGRSGDKPPTAQSCAPPEHPQVLGEVLSLRLLLPCYLGIYAWLNRPLLDPDAFAGDPLF